MRKTLWLAAVLALLLSLTACSGGGEAPSPAVPEDQRQVTDASELEGKWSSPSGSILYFVADEGCYYSQTFSGRTGQGRYDTSGDVPMIDFDGFLYDFILRDDGVLVLAFDRADANVNAFSQDVLIELDTLLERIALEANSGNDLISGEYQAGTGFRGTAVTRLGIDISRSVNAVADVWWTIITSQTVPGNISERQLQDYVVSAYEYYVERGNEAEIDAADANYRKLTTYSADMSARIGDLLYAAGMRERAVKEYEAAVAAAPERRDIVEKIGNYHAERAEESLEKGLLEEAMAGFEKALSVNMLHPTAEKRRLEVAAMIQQRDEHARAITAFERATALDPKLDRAWYGKALSLMKLGRLEEAIVALRRNTELQPMSPYGWYQLGHAYHRVGQTDKLQAVIHRLSGFGLLM